MIEEFYKFFESIGIPMHLEELGVKAEKTEDMAEHILKYDNTCADWMYVPLDREALIRILSESM